MESSTIGFLAFLGASIVLMLGILIGDTAGRRGGRCESTCKMTQPEEFQHYEIDRDGKCWCGDEKGTIKRQVTPLTMP